MTAWMVRWWVVGTLAVQAVGDELAARVPLGRGERGQTTAEFAVVTLVLIIGAIAAIQIFTNGVSGVFQKIVTKLQGAGG